MGRRVKEIWAKSDPHFNQKGQIMQKVSTEGEMQNKNFMKIIVPSTASTMSKKDIKRKWKRLRRWNNKILK